MENSIKSSAINLGLYLGVILAASTVLAYALNLELLTNMFYGIVLFIIAVGMSTFSTYKSKKMLGGFISFKNAFSSFFITIAIGLLINLVVGYIIFNVIDPEAAVTLQEKALEMQLEMLKNFGMTGEALDAAVDAAEKQGSIYSIPNLLKGLAGYLVFYSIIGLITSLIMKRNPVNA